MQYVLRSTRRTLVHPQKSTWPVTGLWNMGRLKVSNDIKLILDEYCRSPRLVKNQFWISQILQRSHIPQTSNWSVTFLAHGSRYRTRYIQNCHWLKKFESLPWKLDKIYCHIQYLFPSSIYSYLVNRPHFGTGIPLFGPFGQSGQ